ncbi:MAG: hypothetical protein MOGMAGMI_00659 [Candidatus Omnitrophica bacterium]|nr:hypothetical protein [Candidatus Omnitrophota bacterium]
MKNLLSGVMLALFSTTLVLGAAEGGLRILYPKPRDGEVVSLEYRHKWTFNSDGYRDEEFAGKARENRPAVLMVGDSFTVGMGVERPDSFFSILERRWPQLTLYNLGHINTGTLSHLKTVDDWTRRLSPRDVVLFLYWNDVHDNLKEQAELERDPAPAPAARRDAFIPAPEGLKDLLRRALLYQWLSAKTRVVLSRWGVAKLDDRLEFELFRVEPEGEALRAWTITAGALERMSELCRQRGVRLTVVYVPKREQFTRWQALLDFYEADPALYGRFAPNERLKRLCENSGIGWIDVSPEIDALDPVRREALYYKWDTHFTPEGYRFYAKLVGERLGELLGAA